MRRRGGTTEEKESKREETVCLMKQQQGRYFAGSLLLSFIPHASPSSPPSCIQLQPPTTSRPSEIYKVNLFPPSHSPLSLSSSLLLPPVNPSCRSGSLGRAVILWINQTDRREDSLHRPLHPQHCQQRSQPYPGNPPPPSHSISLCFFFPCPSHLFLCFFFLLSFFCFFIYLFFFFYFVYF